MLKRIVLSVPGCIPETVRTRNAIHHCLHAERKTPSQDTIARHHRKTPSAFMSLAREAIITTTVSSYFFNTFSFQPVLHDWCNKGHGMCYPVCGMVHIKEPLLLIGKSSLCGSSGFPFSLSEWSLTICLTPYNCR